MGEALALTGLATFRFVLELFIVEEQLFAGGKDEVCAAVYALQHLVLEFHFELASRPNFPRVAGSANSSNPGTPLVRPTRVLGRRFTTELLETVRKLQSNVLPRSSSPEWRDGPPACDGPWLPLVLLFTGLLAAPLAGQRFFHAALLARLEVKRMSLYLFDNVFLLYLALETAQRIFQRFTFLNSYFCQKLKHPQTYPVGLGSYFNNLRASQACMWV